MGKKWTDAQKGMLRRESIQLDSDLWLYEEPEGLSFYSRSYGISEHIGIISIKSILAYVERWKKAREAS